MIVAVENPRTFRLDFDNTADLQGIYVDVGASLLTVPGGIVGNGERFDGTSDIAVPFFKNNQFVSSLSAYGSSGMQVVRQVKKDLFSTAMMRHLDVLQLLSESYP